MYKSRGSMDDELREFEEESPSKDIAYPLIRPMVLLELLE